MFQRISILAVLFSLCITTNVRASNDPAETAGLRHLFFSFGGLFMLDLDQNQKLINMTDGGDRLVMDSYKSGFRYQRNVNAALGVEIPFHLPLPTGLSVGLDLLAGTNASFDLYVKTPQEAREIGTPEIPSRAADLKDWSAGDNVVYLTRGGVGFAAGVGIPPLVGAAAYYFVEGDWFIYVEKLAQNKVFVKVTKTKVRSFGALAHSVIVGVDINRFSETDKAFSFRYDLNDKSARNAYEDALRGSLVPSQRLADTRTGAVERVLSAQDASVGTMGGWYFGIPFLNTIGGKSGDVFNYESSVNHSDGSRSQVRTGIFIDHGYTAGWLSKHQRHINDFFGSTFVTTDAKGGTSKGYAGQYYWAFESDHVTYEQLKRELGELAAKTGMNSLASVRVPQADRYGYLNIKFSAELSQQATDALMAWAQRDSNLLADAFGDASISALESYFSATVADPNHLCVTKDANGNETPMSLSACKAEYVASTRTANSGMIGELKAMAKAKDSDPKEFALHFGRFGKMMATNQFTFREVMTVTRGAPAKMTLTMEGERISRFTKSVPAVAASFAAE